MSCIITELVYITTDYNSSNDLLIRRDELSDLLCLLDNFTKTICRKYQRMCDHEQRNDLIFILIKICLIFVSAFKY